MACIISYSAGECNLNLKHFNHEIHEVREKVPSYQIFFSCISCISWFKLSLPPNHYELTTILAELDQSPCRLQYAVAWNSPPF